MIKLFEGTKPLLGEPLKALHLALKKSAKKHTNLSNRK